MGACVGPQLQWGEPESQRQLKTRNNVGEGVQEHLTKEITTGATQGARSTMQ